MYQRPPLTNEISMSEMRKLRDQGLYNSEIAESLDVTINTVIRYLGKNHLRRKTPKGYYSFANRGLRQQETAAKDTTPSVRPEPLRGVLGDYLRFTGERFKIAVNTEEIRMTSPEFITITFTPSSASEIIRDVEKAVAISEYLAALRNAGEAAHES